MSCVRFEYTSETGNTYQVVIGRSAEMHIIDPNTEIILTSSNIPYGANLYFKNGDMVEKRKFDMRLGSL